MFDNALVARVSIYGQFSGHRPALCVVSGGDPLIDVPGYLVVLADGSLNMFYSRTAIVSPTKYSGFRGLLRFLVAADDPHAERIDLDPVARDQCFLLEIALEASGRGNNRFAAHVAPRIRSCEAANTLARTESFPPRAVAYCVDYVTDTVALERVVTAVHSSGWGDRNRDAFRHDMSAYWAAKVYTHAILNWKGCFIRDPNGLRFLARYRSDGINARDLRTIRLYAKQQGIVD